MRFDLHTHHERCGHAIGTIRLYIESAIDKQLSVIGISDHAPFFASEQDRLKPKMAMAKSEFGFYIEEVLRLKQEYTDQIEVLLGLESEFIAEHSELYREIFAKYPFDYVIGSIHYVNNVWATDKTRWDGLSSEEEIREKEDYYKSIVQSAKSGLFDILGHIDLMKKKFPRFTDIQTPEVERAIKVIAECGVAIEVNTSGKNRECAEWFPSQQMLEMAHFYNADITFGSDAHTPERVSEDWDEVRECLRQIGFKNWTLFRQRQKYYVPL